MSPFQLPVPRQTPKRTVTCPSIRLLIYWVLMSDKSNDDLVLEVAAELELTSKGNFLVLLDRLLNHPPPRRSGPLYFEAEAIDGGIELTIRLKVDTVLAGRPVKPAEVVAVFDTPAGKSRRISERTYLESGHCFELTQFYPDRESF